MINAVGRDIPENILEQTGKDIFRGSYFAIIGNTQRLRPPCADSAIHTTVSLLILFVRHFFAAV